MTEQVRHSHPNQPGDLAQLSIDSITERILNEAGRTLGAALADLCNLLNPSALVIGGALGQHDVFADGVRSSVNRYASPATASALEINKASLGLRAELVGCIELAKSRASVAR